MQLVYPHATFVPIVLSNTGGPLDDAKVRLFVVHIAQSSTQSSIDNWFDNPASQVSSHFSIGRTGRVHQYVKLNWTAWAQEDYNDCAVSIEHVGYSGEKLTRLQLRASLALLRWLHVQFPRVPLRRTGNADGLGVIGHSALGVAGGDHPDCPGSPVLTQLAAALRVPHT